MATPIPRIRVPDQIRQGEAFRVRTLISHAMETGIRKDKEGKLIPRKIINKFYCRYDGSMIFRTDMQPAISANPYISFYTVATKSGELECTWVDDDGQEYKATAKVSVT